MNKILLIIIILIILYICCYYINPNEIIILQTNIINFNLDLLYKKQPIVIEDKILDVSILIEAWFKQNIKEKINKDINIWHSNNHKYLFINSPSSSLSPNGDDDNNDNYIEIFLDKNNKKNNYNIISIKLYPNQSLIIPFKWRYYIMNNNLNIIGIHDYITYLLSFLF